MLVSTPPELLPLPLPLLERDQYNEVSPRRVREREIRKEMEREGERGRESKRERER